MSELIAADAEPKKRSTYVEQATAPSRSAVVITEQEVLFATAAAAATPGTEATHGLISALRARFRSAPVDAVREPRHYPPRRAEFLERAAMSREMRRL